MLTAYYNGVCIQLPIYDNLNGSFVIPARSEVIRHLSGINTVPDMVVESAQIKPGVFCANTIVNKNSPCIRFINATEQDVVISNFKPKLLPLSDFHILEITPNKNERNKLLQEELRMNNVPHYVRERLLNLCNEFSDIFSLKNDFLTCNNFYNQEIRLQDSSPTYIKNYRNAHSQKEEICRQVDKLIENDIIEPSVSNYNSPILLVPKKSETNDKKWRLVVDYRQLNKKLLADKFPLPRIDDILDQLGRAKFFTTLDLMSGFHQIEVEKDSRHITAFSLPERGHFQFKRLPFGLNISPNSFQRMMSIALSGLSPECAFLYIDDVIVVGCSVEHHLKNLKRVFNCFRNRNLKLNPAKCCFFQTEVTFLGHKITDHGILPDNSKFEIIQNYPIPTNPDQVRSFVAFCNYYRRFIPNFAQICFNLNKLLRKDTPFNWTPDCQASFETLKRALLEPQILQYPDFSKPFILTTDASDFACGAVLSQLNNQDDLPVSFASRAFTKGERNKHIIEKELAAIHWAVMHFKPYLYGREFIVRTDHRPLIYLFGMKNPSSKLTRMRLDLEEFQFKIEYIPGKSNVAADALSRIQVDSNELSNLKILRMQTRSMQRKPEEALISKTNNNPEPDQLCVIEAINYEQVRNTNKICFNQVKTKPPVGSMSIFDKTTKKSLTLASEFILNVNNLPNIFLAIQRDAQKFPNKQLAISNDDVIFKFITINDFKRIGNQVLDDVSILIFKSPTLVTDSNEIQRILHNFHNSPTGGHIGINRLHKKLRNLFSWPNMKSTVSKFVKSCELCKHNKHFSSVKQPQVKTTTPLKAFDIVSIDTVGPFSITEKGNRYAVTMQCDLSKYIVIVPVPDKSALTMAKAIVNNCILTYGPMTAIRTDQGTEYKGIFDSVCDLLKIDHKCATAYHPQTLGALERNHRCLNEYLRIFINDVRDNWDEWLSYYSYCYNTTPNTAHDYSPFEIIFGKQPNQFEFPLSTIEPIYNYDLYTNELKQKLQVIHKYIHDKLEKQKLSRTIKNNLPIQETYINIGDMVYLKNEGRKKLDPVQSGPYEITKLNNSNAIIKNIDTNQEFEIHKSRLIKFT